MKVLKHFQKIHSVLCSLKVQYLHNNFSQNILSKQVKVSAGGDNTKISNRAGTNFKNLEKENVLEQKRSHLKRMENSEKETQN